MFATPVRLIWRLRPWMNSMNKEIVRKVFPEMVERVEAGCCPICGKEVVQEKFRDALSEKEFKISGMCQKCQDNFFK